MYLRHFCTSLMILKCLRHCFAVFSASLETQLDLMKLAEVKNNNDKVKCVCCRYFSQAPQNIDWKQVSPPPLMVAGSLRRQIGLSFLLRSHFPSKHSNEESKISPSRLTDRSILAKFVCCQSSITSFIC